MKAQIQKLTLPDGRNIDYLVSADGDGFPFIFIHGTPGSCLPDSELVKTCKSKNVKLITLSRAGYGSSTRDKGATVVDAVKDIQAVKDHLGVKQCLIGGWSGGGPIALACAARLPGCLATLCIAGGAPYEAEGLDWMAGQGQDNLDEFNACFKGEAELREFCEAQRADILASDAAGLIEATSSILPEVDKKVLRETNLGQDSVDGMHEGLRVSADGWIDDDIACVKYWGYDVSEIKVPVILYQGSEDLMVPFSHGQWLAKNLPQEKLKVYLIPGEGHMSIFATNLKKMVDELIELGGVKA